MHSIARHARTLSVTVLMLAACGSPPATDGGADADAQSRPDTMATDVVPDAGDAVPTDVSMDAPADAGPMDAAMDAPGADASDVATDIVDASEGSVADAAAEGSAGDVACADGTACGGACVDTQTDLANCGGCGTACATPAHGAATCAAGTCGFTCGTGFHACAAACADDTSPLSCGASCAPCATPANATATCTAGACGFVCNAGFVLAAGACTPRAPRPLAPLSTATVTSRRPTLRWSLAAGTDGAQVDVCHDRACTTVVATFTGASSAAPAADLPAGVLFWRLRGRVGTQVGAAPGPTWEFTVGARSAAIDTSFGSTADANGDGYADALIGADGANSSTGAAYLYPGSSTGVASSPAFTGAGPDGYAGTYGDSVASAGDVNGDGFVDVVVGAAYAHSLAGRAYVYLGSAAGLGATVATTLSGPGSVGGLFGASVASAGDVNGDGYADVLVGAPDDASSAGRAYLYLGSATGLSATPAATLLGSGDSNGDFGASVSSAGDLDGDGFADVVVGADGENVSSGRIYVFRGSAAGLITSGALVRDGTDGSVGHFGRIVAGAGDLDGDGRSDVVVSTPGANSSAGAVYVFAGTASGIAATPSRTLTGPGGSSTTFGAGLAGAGDVNGDGYADLIVGAVGSGGATDRVHVFLGGAGGVAPSPVSTEYSTDGSGAYFGSAVASAGDVDGDGFADVLVGEWRANTSAGRVFVFAGSASGLVPTASRTLNGAAFSSSQFGVSVGGASW